MKTPMQKYEQDPGYHQLVTMLESLIERAQFTPSELREAVIFACINYEMRHVRKLKVDPEILESLDKLHQFINRNTND